MQKLVLSSLFLFLSVVLVAQIQSINILTPKKELYKRIDFDISIFSTWQNPYLQEDIALDMYITAPSGKELVLPCFYVEGNSGETSNWKALFAAQEIGTYSYYFELRNRGMISSSSRVMSMNVISSSDKGFLKIKNNWVLQFDNEQVFRGIAENICWESRTNDDSKYLKTLHERAEVYNYDYLLTDFARNGGNLFRTWICSWNLPIDFQSNFNNARYTPSKNYYNESAVRRMDYLISLADSLDLYIMLTLGMGNFRERDSGIVKSSDDFFVSKIAKATYKNRLRYIVARWSYSSRVAMWELLNEVDNIQYNGREKPIKREDIVNWHTEMSSYLKEVDPFNHIVTTSISHRDIPGLNDIYTIDINQKHIYKNTDILADEIKAYATKHKKPYIIGEFGYEWDWQKNFDEFSQDMEADFKRGLWYGLFSPTPVLPMSWWWEYFENRAMTSYYRGVRAISDQMLEVGQGEFIPLKATAENLHVYAVKCKDYVYVYVYNPTLRVTNNRIRIELPNKATELNIMKFEPTLLRFEAFGKATIFNHQIIIEDVFIASKKEGVYIIK